MARSHHRKSHKQHLQNFKQHKENAGVNTKSKSAGVFGLIGFVLGMAIGYIATSGSLLWMGVFAIAFGLVGFLVGQKLDKG
jgi:Flp pilus assembly protein TadB